jgi:hypothetical protein
MKRSYLKPLLLTLVLAFTGCVGDNSPSAAGTGNVAAPVGSGSSTGGAAKGILKNASVVVEAWRNGAWAQIGTTTTDDNGQFGLDLSNVEEPVLIIVSTTPQTLMVCDAAPCKDMDEFGQDVTTTDAGIGDFTLEAILPSGKDATDFSVTPLTTLAAKWIQAMQGDITINAAAVNQALSRVADLFQLDSDFYARLPIDITNTNAVQNAVEGGVSISPELLSAAFYADGKPISDVLNGVITAFVQQGGQLGLGDPTVLENTLNGLVDRAQDVAQIALNAVYGDGSQVQDVIDSLNGILTRWGTNATITSAQGANAYDAFSPDEQQRFNQSKALFDQLEGYLHQAGIDENGTFITKQIQQVNWMYEQTTARNDTSGLIGTVGTIGIEAAFATLMQDMLKAQILQLQQTAPGTTCVPMGNAQFCFDGTTSLLKVSGPVTTPNGSVQTADIVIQLPAFSLLSPPTDGAINLHFVLKGTSGDQATLSNATIAGALGATLDVAVGRADPDSNDLIDALVMLINSTAPTCDENTGAGCDWMLQALLHTTLSVGVDLNGTLTRESTPAPDDTTDSLVPQGGVFTVALNANLYVDTSAISLDTSSGLPQFAFVPGKTLLTGTINNGEFVTPRGDFLKSMDLVGDSSFCDYLNATRKTLNVAVAEPSTAEGCFAARLQELPQMDVVFSGQLGGVMGIVNQLITGLLGNTGASIPDVLDNLDVSGLDLTGNAKLRIEDPDQLSYPVYNFALNNNKVDVTQANSSNQVAIYLSSLNGGYLVNNGVWVGTFLFDWKNLGVNVQLADGTSETFALGGIFGALDPQLIQLVFDSLGQIDLSSLSSMMGSVSP